MTKALIDTDIFSEILKNVDPTVVAHAQAYRSAFGRYTISALTVAEAARGLQRKQATAQIQSFRRILATVEVIHFDSTTGQLAGAIAGELERAGQTIGPIDPMIAATAILHNLQLVTGNKAHFECIARLGYPLQLAGWRI